MTTNVQFVHFTGCWKQNVNSVGQYSRSLNDTEAQRVLLVSERVQQRTVLVPQWYHLDDQRPTPTECPTASVNSVGQLTRSPTWRRSSEGSPGLGKSTAARCVCSVVIPPRWRGDQHPTRKGCPTRNLDKTFLFMAMIKNAQTMAMKLIYSTDYIYSLFPSHIIWIRIGSNCNFDIYLSQFHSFQPLDIHCRNSFSSQIYNMHESRRLPSTIILILKLKGPGLKLGDYLKLLGGRWMSSPYKGTLQEKYKG